MSQHKANMYLHTVQQIADRYAIVITFETYLAWLEACKYDLVNKLGDAHSGRWYQAIKHDGVWYYVIVSDLGIHTVLTKKIVRKTLGLKALRKG